MCNYNKCGAFGLLLIGCFITSLTGCKSRDEKAIHWLSEPLSMTGSFPNGRFASQVCSLPDITGDGIGDFAVSSPGASDGRRGTGRVDILSGRDISIVAELCAPVANCRCRFGTTLQWVEGRGNEDGLLIVVESATEPTCTGHICAYARGSLLMGVAPSARVLGDELGERVSGDICVLRNLDSGAPEVVAIVSGQSGGEIALVSWDTKQLIQRVSHPGHQGTALFGFSVARIGDVNVDGVEDLLVGAPYESIESLDDVGAVYALSGLTGEVLWNARGQRADDEFGASASILSDLDKDGVQDIVVGAPGNTTGAGTICVLSGTSGCRISSINSESSVFRFGERLYGDGRIVLVKGMDRTVFPNEYVMYRIDLESNVVSRLAVGGVGDGSFGDSACVLRGAENADRCTVIVGSPDWGDRWGRFRLYCVEV